MSGTIFSRKLITLIGSILIVVGLSACTPKNSLNIFPTKVDTVILASHEINPDATQRPSPVVLRIYELTSDTTFNSADFFQLYDEETSTLGDELVSRQELDMTPGEERELAFKPQINTRYLGVIAAFRNIDKAVWRKSFALHLNATNNLTIKIDEQSVSLDYR